MRNHIESRYLLAAITVLLWGCPIDDAHFAPTGSTGSSSSGEGSSSSSTSSSSSSGGGAGGHGGAAGMGGVMASSSSGGGMGGAAGSGGTGGGPVCPSAGTLNSCGKPGCPDCPTLVMMATGASSGKTSSFVSGTGWSTAATLGDAKSDAAPAFGIIQGQGKGVALIRSSADGAIFPVKYLKWDMNGFGSAINLTATPLATRATPAIVASTDAVHFAISGLGADHKYYYAAYDGTSFDPSEEIIKNPSDSLGYCAPALALRGTNLTFLHPGFGDESLYNRIRTTGTMGTWDMGYKYTSISFQVDDVPPAIVSLSQGPEYLVVLTEKNIPAGDPKPLYGLTGTGTNWTTPVAIGTAKSIEVTLIALSGGHAILAFREYNAAGATPMSILWTRFDGTQWSSVKDAAPGVLAKSKPVLALGAGDAEAELLFIDSAGNAQHARLRKGAIDFDSPSAIPDATGLVGIAAATNL